MLNKNKSVIYKYKCYIFVEEIITKKYLIMEAKIIRNGEFIEVGTIVIKLKDSDNQFRISEDKFGNLVINKYGEEDSCIHVTPNVSNEIKIT